MRKARFLLIRHAESLWNASGRWQGHGDPELSPRGLGQADALAKRLSDQNIDVLISSDLTRAVQTAEAVGAVHGLKPELDPGFRELDVGRWAGLERTEIERVDSELLARFEAEEPQVRAGGAESREALRARVSGAARAVERRHPNKLIALVCHLGVIRALRPGATLGNAEWCAFDVGELAR